MIKSNKIDNKTKMMIVSGYTAKTKFIQIPKQMKNVALVFLLGVSLSISSTAYSSYREYAQIRTDYNLALEEVNKLMAVNESQKEDANLLLSKTEKLQEVSNENVDVLAKVKTLVGLQSNANESQNIALTSRSVGGATQADEMMNILNEEIQRLSQTIDSNTTELEGSKKTIHSKIAYLNAVPKGKPIDDKINAAYGYRRNPISGRGTEFHKGVDLGGTYGANVYATGAGVVEFAGWNAGYGQLVKINHGYGLVTYYAHNSSLEVAVGQRVERGTIISKVGSTGRSTGPHVHYEVRVNGTPTNPAEYF